MIVSLTINENQIHIDVSPNERLVTLLRRLGYLGNKEGCFSGICGACMVLLNNKPVPSCIIPAFQAKSTHIITIEHFAKTNDYKDIVKGFELAGVYMCGFCNTGKILIAYGLANSKRKLTFEHIQQAFAGALCRCTNYEDLFQGIKQIRQIKRKRSYDS